MTYEMKDGSNHDVQLDLDLLHALLARLQLVLNGLVPLIANRLMDGKLFFHLVHQGTPVALTGFFFSSI